MKLKDRVIVVTGGTRGIGRAIAEAAAREGGIVVVCGRDGSAVAATVAALKESGARASGIPADVSVAADLAALLAHADATWGRVDVWVNNAGLSAGWCALTELNAETVAAVAAVNLGGTLEACRIVIPYLLDRGGGVIINLSGKGAEGRAQPNTAVYSATKAAVASLTRSLAAENQGKPISINAFLPGMVRTDMFAESLDDPEMARTLDYVFRAVGVPVEVAADECVGIMTQLPGKVSGRQYSVLRGRRLMLAVARLIWYRVRRKIKE